MRDLRVRRVGALAALALTCATTVAGAQDGSDCEPVVRRIEPSVSGQIEVQLTRACAPYAAVKVAYGPLIFDEELSVNGMLEVILPPVSDAGEVTFSWSGGQVGLAVDPPTVATATVALVWPDGTAWGRLTGSLGAEPRRLGFPRPGAGRVDLLVLGADEAPVLTAPVTPLTCGQALSATLRAGPELAPRPVSVTMPGCEAVGRSLRLTLPR